MFLKKYNSFNNLESAWQKVWFKLTEKSPFSSLFWAETWYTIFSEGKLNIYGLYVDEKNPLGFASFKKKENNIFWSAGEEVTDYQDLVCEEKYKKEFWEKLVKDWGGNKINEIVLRNIPENSLSRKFLKNICQEKKINFLEEQEDVVPFIKLPFSYEDYLVQLSRKNRHELRRKIRRFDNEVGSTWKLVKSSGETHDKDCHDFFVLFRQNGEGKRQFLTPPMEDFFCQVTLKMQNLGLLDFSRLTIDNETISQTISFINDKVLYLYNIAVNPKYYHLSPGIIINKLLIEESIKKGRQIYDFMQGNERYKHQLGGKDGFVYKITIKIS